MLTSTGFPIPGFAARSGAGGTALRPRRFVPHGAARETERGSRC